MWKLRYIFFQTWYVYNTERATQVIQAFKNQQTEVIMTHVLLFLTKLDILNGSVCITFLTTQLETTSHDSSKILKNIKSLTSITWRTLTTISKELATSHDSNDESELTIPLFIWATKYTNLPGVFRIFYLSDRLSGTLIFI